MLFIHCYAVALLCRTVPLPNFAVPLLRVSSPCLCNSNRSLLCHCTSCLCYALATLSNSPPLLCTLCYVELSLLCLCFTMHAPWQCLTKLSRAIALLSLLYHRIAKQINAVAVLSYRENAGQKNRSWIGTPRASDSNALMLSRGIRFPLSYIRTADVDIPQDLASSSVESPFAVRAFLMRSAMGIVLRSIVCLLSFIL